MLMTDVGDKICWWQDCDVGDGFVDDQYPNDVTNIIAAYFF